jgi:hypothetical protein
MGWPGGVTGVAGDFGTGPGGVSVRSDFGNNADIDHDYDHLHDSVKAALHMMADVEFDVQVLNWAREYPQEGWIQSFQKQSSHPTERERLADYLNRGARGEMHQGLKDYLKEFEEADPIGLGNRKGPVQSVFPLRAFQSLEQFCWHIVAWVFFARAAYFGMQSSKCLKRVPRSGLVFRVQGRRRLPFRLDCLRSLLLLPSLRLSPQLLRPLSSFPPPDTRRKGGSRPSYCQFHSKDIHMATLIVTGKPRPPGYRCLRLQPLRRPAAHLQTSGRG